MRRTLSFGLIFSLALSSLVYAQPPQGGQGSQGGQSSQGGQGRPGRPTTRPAHGARPIGRPPGGGQGGGGQGGGGQGGGGGGQPGQPGGPPGAGPGGPPAGGGGGGGGGGRPPHHGRPPTGATPTVPPRPGVRPPTGGRPPVTAPGNRPVWRPGTRPNHWRRPSGSNWWWHGRPMRRFRAPPFMWPHGFAYRRWTVGAFLPRVFLTNAFFWTDWWGLGLPAPPPGFAWVRVGPDLLLVDLASGRVVDAAWGVFF